MYLLTDYNCFCKSLFGGWLQYLFASSTSEQSKFTRKSDAVVVEVEFTRKIDAVAVEVEFTRKSDAVVVEVDFTRKIDAVCSSRG